MCKKLASLLLGLFVLWQLGFLPAANLLELLEELRRDVPPVLQPPVDELLPGWRGGQGTTYSALEAGRRVTRAWSQVTGQPQQWALFGPVPYRDITFPAVELYWGDRESVWLPSENEPADRARYFRAGKFRLRRYEATLEVDLADDLGASPEQTRRRWRGHIERKLHREWDTCLAYFKYRLRHYRRAYPDQPPPRALVLYARRYRTPLPGGPPLWDWEARPSLPVARWRPNQQPPEGAPPVEAYNPVTREFEWLRGGE